MEKKKRKQFVYALVHFETGQMLLEDCKLPLYWNRKVAKQRAKDFRYYEVVQINQSLFDKICLNGGKTIQKSDAEKLEIKLNKIK